MQNSVPAKRAIRIREVCSKTGIAQSSVWRLCKTDPTFPKPVRLSPACTAWFEHEIDEWLLSKRASVEN